MEEIDIHSAAAGDAAALAAVYRSAYRENRELGFPAKAGSATTEVVAEWIRAHRVYVATVESEIVGGVRLEEPDAERIKLSRLGVHADWKGRGIGTRLIAYAESVARREGYRTIWLTTPGEHPFLPEFYRSHGYEQTGDFPVEYREYDEVIMEKDLCGERSNR